MSDLRAVSVERTLILVKPDGVQRRLIGEVMVWEGDDAVAQVRSMMGATNPSAAAPGSIRGDLAVSIGNNVVHGSDSPGRGAEEVALFFQPAELIEWRGADTSWVNG